MTYDVMTYGVITYDVMTYDVMTYDIWCRDIRNYDICCHDIQGKHFTLFSTWIQSLNIVYWETFPQTYHSLIFCWQMGFQTPPWTFSMTNKRVGNIPPSYRSFCYSWLAFDIYVFFGDVAQLWTSSYGALKLVLIAPLNCWQNSTPFLCKASFGMMKIY